MRAEPSISPLTLAVCCAVVAGALALAPGRGPFPAATGRGADVVALEGEAMNRAQDPTVGEAGFGPDGVIDDVEVLGRMISRTESSQGDDIAASCTEDCDGVGDGDGDGGVQPPSVGRSGATRDEAPSDATGGTDQSDTGSDGPVATATGGNTDGSAADEPGAEDSTDVDSCRSPRAVAARDDGPTDVEPPSPCSQGHDPEPCRGHGCVPGRSSGTTEI